VKTNIVIAMAKIGVALAIGDKNSGGGLPSYNVFRSHGVKNQSPTTDKGSIRGARAHKLVPDSMKDHATVKKSNRPNTREPWGSLFNIRHAE